jgi:Ca2+-transporting ATPase
MILTDDDFATIVKAVELGRGLYDNLVKYVRYQMGTLFGFIFSFLGASIFNILGGIPFLPLQTLWVNFTVGVIQSVGLGYGKPAAGLMARRPRDPEQPILPRGLFVWLVAVGLVMAVGTLGVIGWAQEEHGDTVAHTMGLVTFSLYNLFFSITTKDEARTTFTLDTFADKPFAIATAISLATIVLATTLNPLEALLSTTPLTLGQWLVCAAVAVSVVVVSEIRKAAVRR